MKKTLRALTPLSLFVRFLTFATMGALTLFRPDLVGRSLFFICLCALLLNGVSSLLPSLFQRRQPHPHAFLSGAVSLGLAALLAAFPSLLGGGLVFAVGVWSLLVGLIQLGYLAQLFLTGERGIPRYLLLAFLSFAISATLFFSPRGSAFLPVMAGCYLILYGLWQLIDMMGILVNRNVDESPFLSRFRVKLPVLLTALLPSAWLRGLEKRQDQLTSDLVLEKPTPLKRPPEDTLDVIFHLGKNVAFGFGHVDVSLRGQTISYGCYDESSNRLFGLLSDGVFMGCPTVPYLGYCRRAEGKFLVGFSLAVSRREADRVCEAVNRVMARCQPWKPKDRPEYAFGATFCKVKQGGFSVYNALKTNCAAVAELIASETGLKLLPPNGFVTPGAYFGFLENELRDPNSNVYRQTLYARKTREDSEA